jgi:transcriptional regulator with PAS, ATPase and Fis domain
VNCGALPNSLADSILFGYEGGSFTGAKKEGEVGVFEQAQGGTLLLDEISELNLELQTKLLRILQEKELVRIGGKKKIMIDVRIIAASNKALGPLVEKRLFREDLFYRLNVVEIVIPSLRDRKQDIAPLVDNMLFSLNSLMGTNISGITQEARDCLESYSWPGNVRELYNYIERALNTVTAETVLDVGHFPQIVKKQYKRLAKPDSESASCARAGLKFAVTDREKDLIESTLRRTNNSREKTSAILGISPATLWRKMKRYDLINSTSESERDIISAALEQVNYNRPAAAKKLNISTSTLWRKMKKYNIVQS